MSPETRSKNQIYSEKGCLKVAVWVTEAPSYGLLGPVSRKSRKLFGPEKPSVKLATACFGKQTFSHVFKITKTKITVKFDELNALRS